MAEVRSRFRVKEMMEKADIDKNGVLDFDEYFKYICQSREAFAEEKASIRKQFDLIDTDGNGTLSYDELVLFKLKSTNWKR